MKKLEQVRAKRLQNKSDNINDNSELEVVIPEIVEYLPSIDSDNSVKNQLLALINEFSKNKAILENNVKNTLKFLEFEKVYSLLNSLKNKGYDVSSDDCQKDIFDYVIDNPNDTENEVYLSELIETLNLTKVKTKINRIKPILASKIFKAENLTSNSSSIVMDTMFSLMIGKGLNIFQIGEKLCQGTKSFSNGNINVVFRDIELDLVAQYGEDTYQVFSILLAYWYKNKPDNWGDTITLSGDEILEILNEKNKVIRDKNEVKRLSKMDGLNWVAHHCELLKGIRVYSSNIICNASANQKKKTKKDDEKVTGFTIKENPLIEFSEIEYYPVVMGKNYPLFENIEDLHISFKVGEWFKYFDDETYIKQFGYVHKKAFFSKGIVSALLHWLGFKLEQKQIGEFCIKTVIEQIGLKERLEAIYSEADSKKLRDLRQDLFRAFMSALTEIREIDDPYQWEFKNPPQWLMDDSKKPRGWFESWLDVVIKFKHPSCLIAEGKNYKREKIKPEAKLNRFSTKDLKSALAQYSDNKNVSLRKLAEKYGVSQSTLSRKINADTEKFTQTELKNLIYTVHQLGNKK